MKYLPLLILLIATAQAQTVFMHDISILYPKPTVPQSADALKVSTAGAMEELLPKSVYSKLPKLEFTFDEKTQHELLEVMAIRIDPPEVRLVWGVFKDFSRYEEKPRILGLDASVHTFYKLENPEEFITKLKEISEQTRVDLKADMPLSVHPTLLREGVSGAYGTALKKLLLENIGAKNLTKMTFMAVSAVHLRWDFGGFLVNKGKPAALKIAKLGSAKLQTFVNDDFPGMDFSGEITPAPKGQDAFNKFVSNSMVSANRTTEKLTSAHGTAKRIENPNLETSDTIDCVSCHVAQQVRYMSEASEPTLRQSMENRYVSEAFNLSNLSKGRKRTDNVHAFGWFGDAASINQRTINESAHVASKLNSQIK